jgi:pilus assembly protein Flp/PilA
MRRYCGKTGDLLKRMLSDEGGVVSFEYVIVAFCLVATVLSAFGTNANGTIAKGLANALNAIVIKVGG